MLSQAFGMAAVFAVSAAGIAGIAAAECLAVSPLARAFLFAGGIAAEGFGACGMVIEASGGNLWGTLMNAAQNKIGRYKTAGLPPK